jgi:hypothetical protein
MQLVEPTTAVTAEGLLELLKDSIAACVQATLKNMGWPGYEARVRYIPRNCYVYV